MKVLPDNSVDSIVTDPPYGLSFMGKHWDYDVPTEEIWREALRVLKPGGHLLAFFGTRTYHRGVVRIEDAGFEIRDQIMWIYGSGFPKSHNIKEGEFKGWGTALKPANEPIVVARKPLEKGLTVAENVLKYGTGAINIDASRIGTDDKINSVSNQNIRGHMIGSGDSGKERDTIYEQHSQGRWPANIIFDEDAAVMLDEQSGQLSQCGGPKKTFTKNSTFKNISAPGRIYKEENRGASRFFKVISKSENDIDHLCKTTNVNSAENNSKTTKAIEEKTHFALKNVVQFTDSVSHCLNAKSAEENVQNIELDFVLEVARMLNSQDLQLQPCLDYTLDSKNFILIQNLVSIAENSASIDITRTIQNLLKLCGSAQVVIASNIQGSENVMGSKSGPTRFLYQAKASKSERNAGLEGMPEKLSTKQFNTGMENTGCNADNSIRKNAPIMNQNHHPTVKPIKLMQYLINLVTPPNGIVLDPFMGSGSTGVAAKNLGFDFIGCEMNEEYFAIAKKRIESIGEIQQELKEA